MPAHLLSIALFALPVIAFLLGLTRLPTWSCAICPGVEVIAWGIRRLSASANYDMKHALLWIGLLFAAGTLVAWLGGRAISAWIGWASREPVAGPKEPLG
jgi:hypothetical protein